MGYYRTYLKGLSWKLKPIYDLLHKESDGNGQRKHAESKRKIEWKPEFQNVIDLMSPNVIAYPDISVQFTVHCDASQMGLGTALYQEQEGEVKIISLASRK